jgi:predicted nucleic acid-binding protein
MPVIVDTGVLYAAADAGDAWHARVRAWLDGTSEPLIVPVTVVPEVTYLLAARLGPQAERVFVASLAAGEIGLEQVTRSDVERCGALLDEYPHIGFVDASVVAVTERLRVRVVATTDRRHFGAVRPRHVAALELVP